MGVWRPPMVEKAGGRRYRFGIEIAGGGQHEAAFAEIERFSRARSMRGSLFRVNSINKTSIRVCRLGVKPPGSGARRVIGQRKLWRLIMENVDVTALRWPVW